MSIWKGKTILVVGAARQGLAATRFLVRHGAHVILNDNQPEMDLINQTREFKNSSVQFVFGSHPLSLLKSADMVVISGGVPLDIPLIQHAIRKNIPLTNDSQLFMDSMDAKVIGITGSAGKTTTTTLVGAIARSAVQPPASAWIGGNIGTPLIDQVEKIQPQDWIVLELSSFQLELMHTCPQIAVILNITPNHLDRHHTMAAYTSAKINILRYQNSEDWAILNREDEGSRNAIPLSHGRIATFGKGRLRDDELGTFLQGNTIFFNGQEKQIPIMDIGHIKLIGEHNLMNALAACCVGCIAGFSPDSISTGISFVSYIPHRLEIISDIKGVLWINDSIATAPERVLAALNATTGPLILLLGGRDKKLPWKELAKAIQKRKPKVILFGESAALVRTALEKHMSEQDSYPIYQHNDLDDAVKRAADIAISGDTVLLSPGGTSYDAFVDFEERGNRFRTLVEGLQ